MYSSEDLERFYFQYQTEGLPKGISIQDFCINNKVPYNIFSKWYKDTRNKIVEVKVDGFPSVSSAILSSPVTKVPDASFSCSTYPYLGRIADEQWYAYFSKEPNLSVSTQIRAQF